MANHLDPSEEDSLGSAAIITLVSQTGTCSIVEKTFITNFLANTYKKTQLSVLVLLSLLAAFALDLILHNTAFAQSSTTGGKVLPVPTERPEDRSKPLPTFARETATETDFPNEAATLNLRALVSGSEDPVQKGMMWRIYSEKPAENGKLPLLGTYSGGDANFRVKAGYYLVHAAFGYAGQTKRIKVLPPTTSGVFEIKAGGLRLNAAFSAGDIIPSKHLRFEVARHEGNGLRTVVNDVKASELVQLGEGNYHVTSHYGGVNSQATAEVRVKPGKLTELTLYQRGAEVSLKLVSEAGGEALANTSHSGSRRLHCLCTTRR